MNPHRIRLRRPWQCEPSQGGVRWRRPFHRPTGLGRSKRVWIVVRRLAFEGTASLNGRPLGRLVPQGPVSRFDATDRLQPHNELVLDLRMSPPAGDSPRDQPPAEIVLEIETGV